MLAVMPLLSQGQTSRITTLQSARNVAVTHGGQTSNHLLKGTESIIMHLKDGKLIVGNDTLNTATTSVRLKSLPRFALDEDSAAFNDKYSIDYGLLALRRSLTVGRWNSVVLPCSMTGSQLRDAFGEEAQLAAVSNVTDGERPTVEFRSVDLGTDEVVLTAGQHYLLKPSREPDIAEGRETSVSYGSGRVAGPVYVVAGVTLESGQKPKYQTIRSADKQTTVRLRGTFNTLEIPVSASARYVLGDEGYFSQLAEATVLKGFSSYIEDASNGQHDCLRFYIDGVGEDLSDPTGVDVVLNDNPDTRNEKWYDLQGLQVTQPVSGRLYIVGGKKVVRR